MNNLESLGKVIDHQTQRIIFEGHESWEKVLRLHVRPKPSWMPDRLWKHIVGLVLIQSEQKL